MGFLQQTPLTLQQMDASVEEDARRHGDCSSMDGCGMVCKEQIQEVVVRMPQVGVHLASCPVRRLNPAFCEN